MNGFSIFLILNSNVESHLEIDDILASVQHVQSYLNSQNEKEDLNVISRFVMDDKFQQILKIHNKVVEVKLRGVKVPRPTSLSSTEAFESISVQHLSNEVFKDISLSNHYAARELTILFNQPNFKNAIMTHDKIIELEAGVTKEQIDQDKAYLSEKVQQFGGDDDIKIVRLVKSGDPLGATVKNVGEKVVIGRIVKGGVAEKSGLLHEEDEILEINGHDVRGKTVSDIYDLMSRLDGNLTFLIHPGEGFKPHSSQKLKTIHIRALFDYDPEEDNYLPCRDLGFSFSKGDVIHVIDTNDCNWWQAYRDGEDDQVLAGLVPSPHFQLQRAELTKLIMEDTEEKKNERKCKCVSKRKKRKTESNAPSEFLTYEEVDLLEPDPSFKRPIVLIGPRDVGRQELRQRLMESDFDKFAPAIPHTSRPMKNGEINHVDFHFISKQEFEEEISNNKFVEYGEYEKHHFGTTFDAIRTVIQENKTCVLIFHPQAMKTLRESDLRPYFIFIMPQNIESLRQMKAKQNVKFNDESLKKIIEEGREIDEQYSHMFDSIIVITDLDRAFNELRHTIHQMNNTAQWVPKNWLSS
ncbi:hypothetical protein HELRODRAFT_161478 [Helobdella robusta]|uniref:MAGUK p55 subfamily member 5 n=1 Tax=Helobdella robusta TaxID=6412 RepID=T1ERI6_HELRO|nr:hypothetical protein HELRODRAFT_161478 [Helobdella robusta]ESO02234.1 hypothetical protein HELRODRAFT_161478 [Helobdella robusta]